MKFAHLIACGVAAFLPMAAMAEEAPTPTSATEVTTLYPGSLDIPVVRGSSVPADCAFPASLRNGSVELACVVANGSTPEDEIGVQYVAWLGQNGWHYASDIIGGFTATRTTDSGCQQTIGIYPHGEEGQPSGIWFALVRNACTAPTQGR